MFKKSTLTIIITIFLSLIAFQILYYIKSENDYKNTFNKLLVKEAKTHFENIMLKKAQGLNPKLTITNELTNVRFELLKNKKNIPNTLINTDAKEFYETNLNSEYFLYYSKLEVKPSCINCHNKYNVGEVAGVLKVSIPTSDYFNIYKKIKTSKNIYLSLNILFAFLIILLIVWFINRSKHKHLELQRSQRNLHEAQKMANLGHFRIDLRTNEITFSPNLIKIMGIQNSKNIDLKYLFDYVVKQKHKFKILKSFKKAVINKPKKNIEFQIIKQNDRKTIDVSCQVRIIKDTISNKTIVLLGTIQDVTQFVTLRNKLFILEQAINQAPISIVVTNKDANIEYINPNFTKITGYTQKEVIGKNPNILKSKNSDPKEYKELWDNISNGKSWSGTFKNIKKNGEEFWEIALISPVFSPKTKKIIKYLAVKEEITSKLYLQQELKHKEEMLIAQSRDAAMGEMISMIAHQWRQPATAISLCASNILTDIILDDMDKNSFEKNAQTIIDQTQYLSETIDGFRDFFKPNKEKTEFFLKDAVDETYSLLSATLKNQQIVLNTNMISSKKVNTYKKELVQVLINIVKNAQEILVENNITNKTITITEYEKNQHLILEILDNAGGISNENMGKIFEPYFSTKQNKNGTGLGLYISKQIIEKHLNGKLNVQNKNDGACFEIVIPFV